jgi:hypothetical protein
MNFGESMQRLNQIDIRVPDSERQQIDDLLRQKTIKEPTEVVSREGGVFVVSSQQMPPDKDKDKDKDPDDKSEKKPGKNK